MRKSLVSLILVLVLLFIGSFAVNAADSDIASQPRYSYTNSAASTLSISNGIACCTADLTGYQSTTKIKITIELQKKGGLWWNEVDTWTVTYYDNTAILSKSCAVSSGKYRAKSTFVVYCGNDSETITINSPEQEY